ncbi:hypothetical protein CISG_05028 [Coccidioides immitis RMSCC 3703]|uniref:Nuclear speckle splicing regulatory protein 1 N-terminal domain-containing protein n=1 Tax=Coccidioides immitis RMSCC 3703 TaxID=454286 RepID=A0A0J8QUA4_COCIT|nr:hypothetical protein CISG_05028 [Coccidioides immitis RMSCC 3703]
MAPPTLSYGLNLASKKSQPATSAGSSTSKKRKKTIFDSDSDSDTGPTEDTNGEEITTLGGLTSADPEPPSKKQQNAPPRKAFSGNADGKQKDYTNLSALHSSNKHSQTAASIDPSIYDYDDIYDSIHSNRKKISASATTSSGPKYMTSLLRSAEVRKRTSFALRDKLLLASATPKGDDMRIKRKEEERRKKGLGMMGFYKDMLERDGRRHEEAVKAAEEAASKKQARREDENEEQQEEKSAAQIAAELNARGAHIVVNDEGEVVDKRQLLSAGLNVAPKAKAKTTPASFAVESRARDIRSDRFSAAASARSQQRERQTEMIAAQLEERMRKEKQEEEARLKELAEKNKSKKTASDVMSAKERYLARKREREKEKEQEKGK